MGVKYILLTLILIFIGIISLILIIPEPPQNTPQYNTIYLRDFDFNNYEINYKFENNPTRSGTADDRYTEAVHRYHERIRFAEDRIEQKIKDADFLKK